MMDKKIRSKTKQNGEKFQRFRSQIKKTFSKTINRSLSTPRSRANKTSKIEDDPFNKNRSKLQSGDSSRSSTPDISWFLQRPRSTITNENFEQIELNYLNFNNNSHYFINRNTKDKFTFCDACNQELMPIGSVLACKYCQVVVHDKCRNDIGVKCQYNRLSVINNVLDLDRLSIHRDVLKNSKTPESSEVILRKKPLSADTSPNGSEFHTCKSDLNEYQDATSRSFNFYHGGVETIQCCDSLINVTSHTSISSLISQIPYEFSTLDSDSIKAYGIEVNPINQRVISSSEDSLTDVSSLDSSSSFCLLQTLSQDHECRPGFVYNEQLQSIDRHDWTVENLKDRMALFNENNFGLTAEMKSFKDETYLLGTVRVYINLLRPIKMALPSRPPSIFDVIGLKENEEHLSADAKIETLWLPKGTSKQLYVNQSTTTSEVINGILKKFNIKANPKKFGLYIHTIEGERRVSVRKLSDIECPMTMLLIWTEEGIDKFNETMAIKRLVLQENETCDIEWNEFSKPELRNFLLILEREETENCAKIKLKYTILKKEIKRLQELSQRPDNIRSAC